MNKEIASPIDLELRLAEVLRGILARATWLGGWTVRQSQSVRAGWDLLASGPLPSGGAAVLCIECKLHFHPGQFFALAERPCKSADGEIACRVLAMPNVSPRMAALCQQHGWSWFDLAGNCRLEIPGALLIERFGNDPVRMRRNPHANLSSPEAGRVVRALLAPENAGKRWTQREIVSHFGVANPQAPPPSLALVNKVVQHLRNQAFVEELPGRGFRVRDYEGLLHEWRQAWRFDASLRRRCFTLLSVRTLGERLNRIQPSVPDQMAYAAFSAADIQAPSVRQTRTWLYLAGDAEQEITKAIEAKPVDSGENLVILIPADNGVFYHLDRGTDRLPCTNPVQTYVDLVHVGGRGDEAAEALLKQRLKPAWQGDPG